MEESNFIMSFKYYTLEDAGCTAYFAFSFPYSYTELQVRPPQAELTAGMIRWRWMVVWFSVIDICLAMSFLSSLRFSRLAVLDFVIGNCNRPPAMQGCISLRLSTRFI